MISLHPSSKPFGPHDINRSTGENPVNTQDLLRLIHLLNGTNTTEPSNGGDRRALSVT